MTILNTSVSGMLAEFELALVDFAERRERQHDRIQEAETDFSTLVDQVATRHRRSAASRPPASISTRCRATSSPLDGDQSRRPGLRLLCRVRLQRRYIPHAQRLLRPRRVRAILSISAGYYLMGRRHPERLLDSANSLRICKRSTSNQLARQPGRPRAHLTRQPALDRDADRLRRSALGQFGKLDLHRRHVSRRLRQSRWRAHHQSLSRQHRRKHLGG